MDDDGVEKNGYLNKINDLSFKLSYETNKNREQSKEIQNYKEMVFET